MADVSYRYSANGEYKTRTHPTLSETSRFLDLSAGDWCRMYLKQSHAPYQSGAIFRIRGFTYGEEYVETSYTWRKNKFLGTINHDAVKPVSLPPFDLDKRNNEIVEVDDYVNVLPVHPYIVKKMNLINDWKEMKGRVDEIKYGPDKVYNAYDCLHGKAKVVFDTNPDNPHEFKTRWLPIDALKPEEKEINTTVRDSNGNFYKPETDLEKRIVDEFSDDVSSIKFCELVGGERAKVEIGGTVCTIYQFSRRGSYGSHFKFYINGRAQKNHRGEITVGSLHWSRAVDKFIELIKQRKKKENRY